MESLEIMNANEYQKSSLRTLMSNAEQACKIIEAIEKSPKLAQIMVAGMKLSSESGELNDAIIKHISYGQPLDTENIIEECGDLLWYISVILEACNTTMGECMKDNIDKLKIRYPEKFTEKDAAERKDKIEYCYLCKQPKHEPNENCPCLVNGEKPCGCSQNEICDICHPPEPTDKEIVDDGHISDRERI